MFEYVIHFSLIPAPAIEVARRRLLLEIRRCGLSVEDMAEWSRGSWWPSLRNEPEIRGIQALLHSEVVDREGMHAMEWEWAEPQILVRFPDEALTPLGEPHVDELPPWADEGYRYKSIFGVELTNTTSGYTLLRPDDVIIPVRLGAGDVLEMNPDLPHSGSPNRSADIRMALFYRLLVHD